MQQNVVLDTSPANIWTASIRGKEEFERVRISQDGINEDSQNQHCCAVSFDEVLSGCKEKDND